MSVIGGTTLAETGVYNVGRLTQIQPTLQFLYGTGDDATTAPAAGAVAFLPSTNRVFATFTNATPVTVGSTSVAVRTQ